jgi:Tfp pilus assembly protein PilV
MWQRRAHTSRRGYSLLEVMLASAICATALVPALALLRDGLALADKIDTRHQILLCGVSKMEEQLAIVAATWSAGNVTGDFSADGYSGFRFNATRSDAAASGGIAGRLMNVSVTAYSDDNGNSAMDASEARITLTTKVSKLATYEDKAGT